MAYKIKQKLLQPWTEERDATLRAWQAHALAAHPELVITRPIPGSAARLPSDVAAIDGALRVATACRCAEHAAQSPESLPKGPGPRPARQRLPGDNSSAACVDCGKPVEEARRCYAFPTCFACLPPPPELPVLQPANPLRALRLAAGLSQAEAGAAMRVSRGAYANAERAAAVTPAMLERARAALKETTR